MSDNIQGILISTDAVEHIKQLLAKEAGAKGLRLWTKKTGCSGNQYMTQIVTTVNEQDLTMNIDGLTLFVDAESFPLLDGMKIDYVRKGLGSKQLVFINPKEKGHCGCGKSFYS